MDKITFVYGALRSGTTVFGLMLDSHNNITDLGEVDFIFDYLTPNADSTKWRYNSQNLRLDRIFQSSKLEIIKCEDGQIVAKDLLRQLRQRAQGHLVLRIHRNLEKLVALLPDATIIHIIRDPRDVALSCIGMGWAGTTYFGVDQWIETENSWDRIAPSLRENHVMELFYENLILNPEEQLKRACSFIGVVYSSDMLSYPNRSTYEAPDPSAIQQWKRKASARDIALVEIRTKDSLAKRGYRLSGHALVPPGWLERSRLICNNRIYRWRFDCYRFGFINFLGEKLTRRLAKSLHPVFITRMSEISKTHLK
jgi:hypothetical protein